MPLTGRGISAAVLTRSALLLLALPAVTQQRVQVIDGDTTDVRGEVVRIMGLDAPDLLGRCPQEMDARAAAARLEQVVDDVRPQRHGRDVAVVPIRERLMLRPYDGRGRRAGRCR
jgi:endonuclease YncB( thermonuclease family)